MWQSAVWHIALAVQWLATMVHRHVLGCSQHLASPSLANPAKHLPRHTLHPRHTSGYVQTYVHPCMPRQTLHPCPLLLLSLHCCFGVQITSMMTTTRTPPGAASALPLFSCTWQHQRTVRVCVWGRGATGGAQGSATWLRQKWLERMHALLILYVGERHGNAVL